MAGKSKYTGLGVAFGAIAGAALGVAAGHIAIWLATGVAIGVAIGASLRGKGSDCPQCAQMHQHHTTKVLTK
jgi:uncharacterized membrane protein YoaK (UPF0700 family)